MDSLTSEPTKETDNEKITDNQEMSHIEKMCDNEKIPEKEEIPNNDLGEITTSSSDVFQAPDKKIAESTIHGPSPDEKMTGNDVTSDETTTTTHVQICNVELSGSSLEHMVPSKSSVEHVDKFESSVEHVGPSKSSVEHDDKFETSLEHVGLSRSNSEHVDLSGSRAKENIYETTVSSGTGIGTDKSNVDTNNEPKKEMASDLVSTHHDNAVDMTSVNNCNTEDVDKEGMVSLISSGSEDMTDGDRENLPVQNSQTEENTTPVSSCNSEDTVVDYNINKEYIAPTNDGNTDVTSASSGSSENMSFKSSNLVEAVVANSSNTEDENPVTSSNADSEEMTNSDGNSNVTQTPNTDTKNMVEETTVSKDVDSVNETVVEVPNNMEVTPSEKNSADCNLTCDFNSGIKSIDKISEHDNASNVDVASDMNIEKVTQSEGKDLEKGIEFEFEYDNSSISENREERYIKEGDIDETDKEACVSEQSGYEEGNDTFLDTASGEDLLEGGIKLIDVRSLREEDSSGNDSREISVEREAIVSREVSSERESSKAVDEQTNVAKGFIDSTSVCTPVEEEGLDRLSHERSEKLLQNQSVDDGTRNEHNQSLDKLEPLMTNKDIEKQVEISQTSYALDKTKGNTKKEGDHENVNCFEKENSSNKVILSEDISVVGQDSGHGKEKIDVDNKTHGESNKKNVSNIFTGFDDSIDDDEDDSDGRLMIDTETENEDDNRNKAADYKQTESVGETRPADTIEGQPDVPQDGPSDIQMHVETEEFSADILAVSRCEPMDISETRIVSEGSSTKSHQTISTNSVSQSTPGIVIKEEPVDDGYNISQRGDILDILSHQAPATQASSHIHSNTEKPRKRKRKGNAEKLAHPEENEGENRIKQEPVEDYGQFNPFSSIHTRNQNVSTVVQSSPANLMATNITRSNVRSDSLSLLSKQVERIPSVLGQPAQIPQLQSSDNFVRFQLNTNSRANAGQWMPVGPAPSNPLFRQPVPNQVHFARYTLQVTPTTGPNLSFSVPAPRIISTERPSAPQMTVIPPSSAGTSKPSGKAPSKAPAAKEKFSVISRFLTPQGQVPGNTVATTTSTESNVASVKNVKLHPLYASVPTTSSTNTAQPANQGGAKKMPENAMTSKTINIDSVGLTTITDLIARKNPMANYKPEPVPQKLLDAGYKYKSYVCFECGDTFNLESSLKLHQNRYSLQISYKCDNCYSVKVFFNKCQFLSHLRGHLNIEKTQAVPIHIKSDSIAIEPLSTMYENLQFQPKTLSVKTMEEKCMKRCTECGKFFLKGIISKHFNNVEIDRRHQCNHCKLCLTSVCSLRAHKRMHGLEPPFTCPDCGLNFSDLSAGELNGTPLDRFFQHITHDCVHLSRKNNYVCTKCPQEVNISISELKRHLLEKMDQYYKCNMCPMAFKMQETFTKHYTDVHAPLGKKPDRYFKVLFRCHSCDSLIDDRYVLDLHIQQHLNHAKSKPAYVFFCFFCRAYFKSKTSLKKHINVLHKSENKNDLCPLCKIVFKSTSELLKHYLDVHTKIPDVKVVGFCNTCGFFHRADKGYDQHICLSQKTCKVNIPKGSQCSICGKLFINLLNHLLSHQKEGMMLCIYCQRRDFENTRERVEHELVCQKKKTTLKPILPKSNPKVKSTFSGEVESSASQLSSSPKFKPKVSTKNKVGTVIMQPSVSLSTLVEFPCGKCSKKFVTPESLESHKEKEHSRPELFPCHLCGLTYESQQSMRRHLKMTHEGRRNVYPCLMCRKKGIKKQFSNRLVLEKHLMAKHKITKSKLTSNIVPEYPDEEDSILPPPPPIPSVVKRKADLKAAADDSPIKRLRVAGDQLFNCAKCSFSCEDRTKFLEHLKEHNISNTIQCLECGLCFAIVQSLRKHLFMVHKIKDFEKYCVDEGLEFKEEEVDLIIQESHSDSENISHDEEDREHSGDPLECRVCYRKFEDQAKLRSHMRNHGMAFIRNRRRERTNSLKTSPSKSINGNESSDSSVSTA